MNALTNELVDAPFNEAETPDTEVQAVQDTEFSEDPAGN